MYVMTVEKGGPGVFVMMFLRCVYYHVSVCVFEFVVAFVSFWTYPDFVDFDKFEQVVSC